MRAAAIDGTPTEECQPAATIEVLRSGECPVRKPDCAFDGDRLGGPIRWLISRSNGSYHQTCFTQAKARVSIYCVHTESFVEATEGGDGVDVPEGARLDDLFCARDIHSLTVECVAGVTHGRTCNSD